MEVRESHYQSPHSRFDLFRHPDMPDWRKPQLGALAAVLAQWSVDPTERVLVSMPTGSGKSAVATALPYVARARRTLVLVPSVELRNQMHRAFVAEHVLRSIGALGNSALKPVVEVVRNRKIDWDRLSTADVVIALPNSISPEHSDGTSSFDPSFFDLVIIDEAHHAPARTWRAVLDQYPSARAVLLTATPRRADGRLLPGVHAFHYPLRSAMADGIYKPIRPNIIDVAPDSTLVERDTAIATALVQASNQAQHESSAVLIRVDSLVRATQVQIIYRELGLEAAILTSEVAASDRAELMEHWRSGVQTALIVVDMLGEGIDLPNLRLVGYHDKHKSVNATMQFIGRLARENPEFPQESVLTTVRDQDIYPYLQGVLRSLYDEDADWATILPGLIDDEIDNARRDAEYVAAFQQPPATLNLNSVAPLARAVLYEVPEPAETWRPDFVDGAVPDETAIGAIFASQRVAYAGINRDATQFLLVTTTPEHPDWYLGDELTHPIFDLHVVSWHASPQTNRRHVLMINTKDNGVRNALIELFDPHHILRNADPGALQDAFDSLERRSVSSVGVRNTYAAPQGTPAYAMFQGKSIEGGLRESDTSSRALGHAMAQVNTHDGQLVSAGIASAKGKYWERRHLSLREYERFCAELVGRYWSPQQTESGPLLPNVARGKRTEAFPSDPIITAELNPSLFGQGWQTSDGRLLDNLEIDAANEPPSNSDVISLRLFDPAEPNIDIWAGQQDINGHFTTTSSRTPIRRGQSGDMDFGQLAEMAAPAVYFLNGQTVMGTLTYDPIRTEDWIPAALHFDKWNWAGVDIRSEAKLRSGAQGATIHQQVETYLCVLMKARNDGSSTTTDQAKSPTTSSSKSPHTANPGSNCGTRNSPTAPSQAYARTTCRSSPSKQQRADDTSQIGACGNASHVG